MAYSSLPRQPITPEQAVEEVRSFIAERDKAGVTIAAAFTEIELSEGMLTATWDETKIGTEKSKILLEANPFENLATFVATPLAFDNELGRQIRQHVKSVSVIGPFGVGTLSTKELFESATGLSAED